jgi:hypothetical protein
MTLRRTLAIAPVTLLLLASLTGCFAFPGLTGDDTGGEPQPEPSGGAQTSALSGTSWSGIDSDGDSWDFDFQSDGTVGFTYNGKSYDDATDTWAVSGETLSIHVAFSNTDVDLTGQVAEETIDLDGTYSGETFTLTITQD